jgi:hypothetical protein
MPSTRFEIGCVERRKTSELRRALQRHRTAHRRLGIAKSFALAHRFVTAIQKVLDCTWALAGSLAMAVAKSLNSRKRPALKRRAFAAGEELTLQQPYPWLMWAVRTEPKPKIQPLT